MHLLSNKLCPLLMSSIEQTHMYTGQQAIIRHQQLLDTVGLYGVFLHIRESGQFRPGKGHHSKSQNAKKLADNQEIEIFT